MATGGISVLSFSVELSAVNEGLPEAFDGVYIKDLSTLRAAFTINGSTGGATPSYKVRVGSRSKTSESNVIELPLDMLAGEQSVVCTAKLSTMESSVTKTIYLREYTAPKVAPAVKYAKDIVCGRCTGDGTLSIAGENLRLRMKRSYAPVADGDGEDQRNFCAVRCRWKAEYAEGYSDWTELLNREDLSTDEVDMVLTDNVMSVKNGYTVQVGVWDDMGNSHVITKTIPATYDTPLHLGKGGKNLGLGQYCDYSHSEAVDIGWQVFFNKGIGAREVFCAANKTDGWASGELLSDALPDADVSLLKQGTVFLAVMYHYFTRGISTAPTVYRRLIPILCVKIEGEVAGQSPNVISGYAWKTLTDDFGTQEDGYPIEMTYVKDSDSYELTLDETDSTVKHIAALYVLL